MWTYSDYDDDIISSERQTSFGLGAWLIDSPPKRAHSSSSLGSSRSDLSKSGTINPELHQSIRHLKPSYHWPGENSLSIDLSAPVVLKWVPSAILPEGDPIPCPNLRVGDRVEIMGYKGDAIVRAVEGNYFVVSLMVVFKVDKREYLISWRRSKWFSPKSQEERKKIAREKHEEERQSAWFRRQDAEPAWRTGTIKKEKKMELKKKARQRDEKFKEEIGSGYKAWKKKLHRVEDTPVAPPKPCNSALALVTPDAEKIKHIGVSERQNRHKFKNKTEGPPMLLSPPQNLWTYFERNRKHNITLQDILRLPDCGSCTASPTGKLHDGFLVIDLQAKFSNPNTFLPPKNHYRRRARKTKAPEVEEERGDEEEEEAFIDEPVVQEIEELREQIEIRPTQTISELLQLFGGPSTCPEDIFNPKGKKLPKPLRRVPAEATYEAEEVVGMHENVCEVVTAEQLYPQIDTEAAKKNLFFDEIPEEDSSFYFSSLDNFQGSEVLYYTTSTVPTPPDIYWSEGAGEEARGFIFVQ